MTEVGNSSRGKVRTDIVGYRQRCGLDGGPYGSKELERKDTLAQNVMLLVLDEVS